MARTLTIVLPLLRLFWAAVDSIGLAYTTARFFWMVKRRFYNHCQTEHAVQFIHTIHSTRRGNAPDAAYNTLHFSTHSDMPVMLRERESGAKIKST